MSRQDQDLGLRVWVVRVGLLLAAGGVTAGALIAELRPLLLLVAGGGGGVLASRVFAAIRGADGLRSWVVRHWDGPRWEMRLLAQIVGYGCFSPRTAALMVALLGAVFSGAATAILAWAGGAPINEAWAAFVAFVASQLVYLWRKPWSLSSTPASPTSSSAPTGGD